MIASLILARPSNFGLLILADFCARLYVSPHPVREFGHPSTWADIVAIFSFLAPVAGEGLGFLRILRWDAVQNGRVRLRNLDSTSSAR